MKRLINDDGLPNIYDNFEVEDKLWNHLDFIWGINAVTKVYAKLIENMARAEAELR